MDFKYFPELPTEIRLEIWHYALLLERVVEVRLRHMRTNDVKERYRRFFKTPAPSLMGVNRESRNEAIQRYTLLNFTEKSEVLDSELWRDPLYLALKQKDPISARAYVAKFMRKTSFTTLFNTAVDTIYLNLPPEPLVSYHHGNSLGRFTWPKYQYCFTGLAIAARAFNTSDELLGQKLSILSRQIIRLKNVKEVFLVFDDQDSAAKSCDFDYLTTSFTPYPEYQKSELVQWFQERLNIKATILNYAHRDHQKKYAHHFPMQLWVAPKVRAMRAVMSLVPCGAPKAVADNLTAVSGG